MVKVGDLQYPISVALTSPGHDKISLLFICQDELDVKVAQLHAQLDELWRRAVVWQQSSMGTDMTSSLAVYAELAGKGNFSLLLHHSASDFISSFFASVAGTASGAGAPDIDLADVLSAIVVSDTFDSKAAGLAKRFVSHIAEPLTKSPRLVMTQSEYHSASLKCSFDANLGWL